MNDGNNCNLLCVLTALCFIHYNNIYTYQHYCSKMSNCIPPVIRQSFILIATLYKPEDSYENINQIGYETKI